LIASGEDAEHSIRLVRPTGELRFVTFRAVCEKDSSGHVKGLFGVILDLTEFKLAEDQAGKTSALLSATLENMDQGIMMVDADGTVQVCNRRAIQLLGLAPDPMAS